MNARLVQFGDVVREVTIHDRTPTENGLERYVGLDHLDPHSLKIKRWGLLSEGTTFTKRFQAGQVLFGRRRAYQRKAAVPDFDGICSSDILIFEAKSEYLLPELLPFLVHTDAFFDYALGTSSGSLSPRTKWSHLAKFKFHLPPIARQQELVELFQAIEDAIAATEASSAAAEQLKRSLMHQLLTKGIGHTEFKQTELGEIPVDWDVAALANCLEGVPESGFSPLPSSEDTGFHVLALNALTHNGYVDGQWKPINEKHFDETKLLKSGDFLISRSNTQDLVGFVGIVELVASVKVIFSDLMMRLHMKENFVCSWYLLYYLQSPTGRRLIQSIAAGTSGSMKKINKTNLMKIKIPLPTRNEQDKISSIVLKSQENINHLENHLKKIDQLKFQVVNALVSGNRDLISTQLLRELINV